MSSLEQALNAYFEREAKANATPQGADVAELLEQTAADFGVQTDVLTEAMLDASVVGVG